MSVSASLSVGLSVARNGHLSKLKMLEALLSGGWTGVADGEMMYLPPEDDGAFDWVLQKCHESPEASQDTLLRIFEGMQTRDELIGIVLTWKDTSISAMFLFDKPNHFSAMLYINRLTVDSFEVVATGPDQRLGPLDPNIKITVDVDFDSMKGRKHTDAKAYLRHIVDALGSAGISIEWIKFSEAG